MKKCGYFAAVVLVGFSVTGCMNRQGEVDYARSGVLAGAATGSVIGSSISHSPEGAIVGAAIGAITGGAVGSGIDQEKSREQYGQTVTSPPMSLYEIKELAGAGISDDVIISQIHASGAIYYLASNDIIDLKNNGISEKVIDYLINTPYTAVPAEKTARGTTRVYRADPVIIAPYPHYIWFGGSWMWYDGHSGMGPRGMRAPGPGRMH